MSAASDIQYADAAIFTAIAARLTRFLGTMRLLKPAIDAAKQDGVVPAGPLATAARIYWMQSQTALASGEASLPATATLDALATSAARTEALAPYVLSTLQAERARRLGAPARPSPQFERGLS